MSKPVFLRKIRKYFNVSPVENFTQSAKRELKFEENTLYVKPTEALQKGIFEKYVR